MTAVVQPDTGEVTVLMTEAEANEITDAIRKTTGELCFLVLEAHDKQAWKAKGYRSWNAYVKHEFPFGKTRSFQLVKYAEVIVGISAATGTERSTVVDRLSEAATRGIDPGEAADIAAEAVADLPADATDDEVASAAVAAVRARKAAETPAAPAGPGKCTEGFDCPAVPGPDGMCAWHRGRKAANDDAGSPVSDGPPVAPDGQASPAAPTGTDHASVPEAASQQQDTPPAAGSTPDLDASSVVDGQSGSGEEPVAADDLSATHPLPDDWRDRIARSAQLLGCPVDALRDVLTDDDRIDLTDLRNHLNLVLQEQN